MPLESALSPIREGIETLRTNRLRTALSMLGVVIGVASLVAVLSVGDGMEGYMRTEMARTTSVQNVFVSPVLADTVDGITVARDRWVHFGPEDARRAAREVPQAAGVSIAVTGTTLVSTPQGGRRRGARVTAALPSIAEMYGIELFAGRFFTEVESERAVPVAVVSYALARAVAPAGAPELAVGQTVRLRGTPFKVVGVLKQPEFDEGGLSAYVPLRSADAALMPSQARAPRTLVLQARRVEGVEALRSGVEDWLATRYGRWEHDLAVGTEKERLEQMRRAMKIFKLFMGAITAISLLVGGIGIMNVLLASVTERTREIGIRKAAGARRRDILVQFLAESVAISGTGSLLGLIAGLLGAQAVTALMRKFAHSPLYAGVSAGTLLVAAASAIVVGLSFGTYPARRAARLSPIDAIRHE